MKCNNNLISLSYQNSIAGFRLQNIFTAWKHNPGIYRLLAIPIGVSKAVLGLLFVATWVEMLFGSTKKRRNQTIQMGILAGLLSGLICALVNGDEVMESRINRIIV